ncbi:MAG: 2-amino-4-hydroxy-6-hydroxymethyldihydropteridine diphosphokinase, partial [Planctomycetota bacterium]
MPAERVVAAIALGANVGEREKTLQSAVRDLERTPAITVLRRSRWVETRPVGGPPGQGLYLNGAVLVETALAPRELLDRLLAIELRHGRDRVREGRHGPRTLDLDLLFHGAAVHDEPGLVVPHPRLEDRRFVLEPLAEIAPEHRLARCGRTVAERLAELAIPAEKGRIERLETPAEAREWCAAQRSAQRSIGFVPTMGALHEGHLTLVRRAVLENDVACVSVFVNPLQFDDARDLERYPRDFERDAAKLAGVDCAMVFTGTLAQFFPGELDARGALPPERVLDPGPRAEGLEGEHRPGHFAGVATIVDRLFDVVAPDRAYFGRKDFQ